MLILEEMVTYEMSHLKKKKIIGLSIGHKQKILKQLVLTNLIENEKSTFIDTTSSRIRFISKFT